jgi:meiosis arrest female protein 1
LLNISGDVNFAPDLSDLRHRKKFDVVLIHKEQVNDALLSCATEHHLYEDLIKDLPERPSIKVSSRT